MRVEPASQVYRFEDRPPRTEEHRAHTNRNEKQSSHGSHRTLHETPHVWFHSVFGAHLLGLIKPERATRATAARAYTQPEARTPLRPREDVRV